MIVRHSDEMTHEDREKMRGGLGTVSLKHVLSVDEMSGKGRLFSEITIPVGASVGLHPHDGESEYYYLLAGTGRYRMDDDSFDVAAGDLTAVSSGHTHGIENTGDQPITMIALILFD